VAVAAFLDHRSGFKQIERVVQEVMNKHEPVEFSAMSDILAVAAWARRMAEEAL
jgi:1-deoxy-D-xylulose 5-phosphate reductoisomerase